MNYIFAFFAGLFVTIVLVPPLIRTSGFFRLVDEPDWRKVHDAPIPRIGGIALSVATVLAAFVWIPPDPEIIAYLAAGAWIVLFGALDDARDLNYKWKFLAQLPPVILVMHSGILLHHLPFFGLDPAPGWISITVTFTFFLGVINAVNLFDGLDGLAGGCILLSLAAIAFLAFVVGAGPLVFLCLILAGAIIGFLNYNSHPASIFLGDAGSQFLGFSVATFSILLTEQYHTALSPVLPFLLLGLPIIDTAWVTILRLLQGKSPFHADKQHLHHQLLNGGLTHGQAVSSIYFFQALFVGTALALPYGTDATLTVIFFTELAAVMTFMLFVRTRGKFTLVDGQPASAGAKLRYWNRYRAAFHDIATYGVEASLGILLVATALFTMPYERDIAAVSLGVAGFMIIFGAMMPESRQLFMRIGFYVAGALAVYGIEPLHAAAGMAGWVPALYLGALVLLLSIAIASTRRELFRVSPQDLLVGLIVLAAAALRDELLPQVNLAFMIIAGTILFYAGEYIISTAKHRLITLPLATFGALLIMGVRGFWQ